MIITESELPALLKDADKRVVGMKQVLRFAEAGNLQKIYIAGDTDKAVFDQIITAANRSDIEVCLVASKELLGKACGIQVNAACAGIIENTLSEGC